MKYLVTMELVEPLPASLEGTLEHLQAMIIPSHKILAQMEQDKKSRREEFWWDKGASC
ncbi:MAG: hypothetical protein HY741_08650 [Chloroflexi bacterium]|nr:hypothetical protein [Chloroflexota bacterium]